MMIVLYSIYLVEKRITMGDRGIKMFAGVSHFKALLDLMRMRTVEPC